MLPDDGTIPDQKAWFKEQLAEVEYKDWEFLIGGTERIHLRVRFATDGEEQLGRKWYLSPYMSRSELVQTALLAVLQAEEHEARRQFHYKRVPIFAPYYDVDQLAEFAKLGPEASRGAPPV